MSVPTCYKKTDSKVVEPRETQKKKEFHNSCKKDIDAVATSGLKYVWKRRKEKE